MLVSSLKDPASRNIARALIEKHGFNSTGVSLKGNPVYQKDSFLLASFEEEIVRPPDLDAYFNPLAYMFLSRHVADSGIPSLTAHTTGNFSKEAKFGGNPREIGRVNPDLLKNYMISLAKRREIVGGYQVTIEATHHGPTSLLRPLLFVEIGSSEKNWDDPVAGEVVADAVMDSLTTARSWDKVGIGFGGTHYSEKFNDLLIEGDVALAAVVPRYALELFDPEMLGQVIQKSTKPVRYAVLDWKGLSNHKDKVNKLCEQFGLEMIRV
ncbi:MAG: D-tyrosyl-tRNA(Tyr) deacylase [Thaumarchaeota archaeon]|nr:D-tyrosyl-tRNA(Tyr) deacylase [Nitrososphaerota archaeon]